MHLSSKILKGFGNNVDSTLLEIRHSFDGRSMQKSGHSDAPASEKDVRQLLEEAKNKAEVIIASALEEAEKHKENTNREALVEAERIGREAYERSFEEGKKDALDNAEADAVAIRDEARSVLDQSEKIRKQMLESLEKDVLELSVEIAEKVLNFKLKLDPQIVVDLARDSIDLLKEREQVVLFVNPYEVGFFEERKGELLRELSPKGELHIVADKEIAPGGCIVETEYGKVDAQLKTRWQTLIDNLGIRT
ncbi:MAG: hypothetical protein HGA27_01565 [Peptococcaceae bacterium]|nr:hypothetical protein [Peptococcaceae bacterium]